VTYKQERKIFELTIFGKETRNDGIVLYSRGVYFPLTTLYEAIVKSKDHRGEDEDSDCNPSECTGAVAQEK